jgi:hypothetical protein
MKRVSLTVPTLPEGKWKGTIVRRDTAWRGPKVSVDFFVADEAIRDFKVGAVFVINRDSIDLLGSWGTNEKTRRRWCSLAKVKYSTVQSLMQSRRNYEATDAAKDEIERARRICAKHGYSMHKK